MRQSDLSALQQAITAMSIVREVIPREHAHSHLLFAAIQALRDTIRRWHEYDYEEAEHEMQKKLKERGNANEQ